MSQLQGIIPGAEHWPRFQRNRRAVRGAAGAAGSAESTSLFFAAWSARACRWRWRTAKGRGIRQRHRPPPVDRGRATSPATASPGQLSGQPERFARTASPASTSRDGRATILMPHPERTPRSSQLQLAPRDWRTEDSPWLRDVPQCAAWLGEGKPDRSVTTMPVCAGLVRIRIDQPSGGGGGGGGVGLAAQYGRSRQRPSQRRIHAEGGAGIALRRCLAPVSWVPV